MPRAEIAMVIVDRARELGPWAVPESVYAAMICVCAATCVFGPLALRPVLGRGQDKEGLTT